MYSNISQLQEMGFTQEQAETALKQSNNNLEEAIGYLFGEAEQRHPNQQEIFDEGYMEDTVQISNPSDIPQIPSLTQNDDVNPASRYGDWGADSEASNGRDESLFELETASTRQQGVPPAVVPTRKSTIPGFIVAFYIIIGQINSIAQAVMSKDLDQVYSDRWFCSDSMKDGAAQDGGSGSRDFLVELQRVLGFLTALSDRARISADGLSCCIQSIELEDWEDALKHIDKQLVSAAKDVLDKDLSNSFSCQITFEDGSVNDFKVFDVEHVNRGETVVDTLNNLLWSDQLYTLDTVSPVIAIQFSAEERGGQSRELTVEEYFYPSIYSSAYQPIIQEMKDKKLAITKARSALTSRIMSLNSFEGKKVRSVLEATREYLDRIGESESFADISKLLETVKAESIRSNEKVRSLNTDFSNFDSLKHENVLNQIKASEAFDDTPPRYVLVGAIFSDTEYLYRARASDNEAPENEQWVLFSSGESSVDPRAIDYTSEYLNFEDVQSYIKRQSSFPNRPFLIVFASEDSLADDTEVVIPNSLKEFFAKDNQNLAKAAAAEEMQAGDVSESEPLENYSPSHPSRDQSLEDDEVNLIHV